MTAETRPLLDVRGLNHDYAGVAALSDIDFQVEAGERVVILGPSGCGKTSLLHILSGLMSATSGSVLIAGKAPRPGIDSALVFQNPRLLPWRSVATNIEVVLKPQPPRQGVQPVEDLLARVGLQGLANKWPHELSGGMKQRLALARALALECPLLLLDEPFANLDPLAREDMQEILLNLTTSVGMVPMTTVLVTHSVEEALVVGDRIILLSRSPGRVVEEKRLQLGRSGLERRSNPLFYSLLAEISSELRLIAK